ncbi:1,4-dihydroxy-2-naphthoate polyprenyltransferase [Amphibacillus sp. MSJ-3]|uniref:1,4-dihydroxy-2-naphthoate polyprenyltransferase n=1 Tax=Amphibacillus sp. MSJ-3 TaxID=2841505 RepID=UPI001C0F33FE|nr:1,4-dihydroxy-2-naphthoate polyprenyltransferase [Amphibacillus sp. MSJ-3]MBU5595506.1 1,4-dihydroxy-2-naphthoate polyprenyltransferase [Amphibacillus sp. MSJ-3]
MSVKTFLKLVEIQTKIASLFPFLIGLLFVIYRYERFNLTNTIIFFVAMLLFDLTTTAINNYMDYQKASSDAYRNKHNIIGQAKIPISLVRVIIFSMLIISTGLGLWLVYRTDLFVLLIGMLCFGIGIFYTFGPIPLSRMPLGEVFSGLTMGFGIVFLTVYVNAYDQGIVSLFLDGTTVQFEADLVKLIEILLISLPSVLTISNLMLANNICDLDDDIKNFRFTLPYYIGKRNAIRLFNLIYILVFIILLIVVLLDLLPITLLAALFIAYPVYKNVSKFNKKQLKAETFSVSVKNLVLVNGSIFVLFLISILWI